MSELKLEARTVGRDFMSGIIVFLVALPLCLGIAIASDADPIAGLISGVIGGIVVGLLSGSHTSVSGPAAGLTAIVAAQIANLGSYETFLLAVFLAGVIQVGFGLLKAGALSAFFPSSVIKGLLAAIGVILILKQLPLLFGYTKDMGLPFDHVATLTSGKSGSDELAKHSHEIGDIVFSFIDAIGDIVFFEGGFQWGAIIVGFFSLAFLIGWDRVPKLKKSLFPSPLLVVIFGSLLGWLVTRMGGNWAITSGQLVDVPSAGSLSDFASLIRSPDFRQLGHAPVYIGAITIAVVASLETLLNLDAVDKLDTRQRISPPNRELFAQGVGNMTAGLLGGIPVTSVVIRGSVNVNSGAETKLSSVIHGVLLLACVLLIPQVLRMIPLSCLAAILLMTGFKLASPGLFRQMAREGRYQFLPFIFTLTAIVLTDLLIGICIGMVLSILFILNSNLRRPVRKIHEKHMDGDLLHIELGDQVAFLNKASLEAALREAPRGSRLLLDARRTDYIDPDVLSLIREFREKTAPAFGISMQIVGLKEKYKLTDKEDTVDFSIQQARENLTPQQVIGILRDGNKRFVEGHPLDRSLLRAGHGEPENNSAIAVFVSDFDSLAPVEVIFDLGVGDAFVVRVPGIVVGPRAIGGVEYAVAEGGAKLVVVMGHADSSLFSLAIHRVCALRDQAELTGCASLMEVIDQIGESIDVEEARRFPEMSRDDQRELMNKTARKHLARMAEQLVRESESLGRLVAAEKIRIVTAMLDTTTGSVELPMETQTRSGNCTN